MLTNSTTKPHADSQSLRVAIASACCLSSVRCCEQAVNAGQCDKQVAVAELKKRKARADVSSWVAFFAYIVGTCLVIFGRVVDKLV